MLCYDASLVQYGNTLILIQTWSLQKIRYKKSIWLGFDILDVRNGIFLQLKVWSKSKNMGRVKRNSIFDCYGNRLMDFTIQPSDKFKYNHHNSFLNDYRLSNRIYHCIHLPTPTKIIARDSHFYNFSLFCDLITTLFSRVHTNTERSSVRTKL